MDWKWTLCQLKNWFSERVWRWLNNVCHEYQDYERNHRTVRISVDAAQRAQPLWAQISASQPSHLLHLIKVHYALASTLMRWNCLELPVIETHPGAKEQGSSGIEEGGFRYGELELRREICNVIAASDNLILARAPYFLSFFCFCWFLLAVLLAVYWSPSTRGAYSAWWHTSTFIPLQNVLTRFSKESLGRIIICGWLNQCQHHFWMVFIKLDG